MKSILNGDTNPFGVENAKVDEATTYSGTVKWFKSDKGYGFITPTIPEEQESPFEGKDLFVHYSDLNMEGYKTLTEGETVSFTVETSSKGYKAINVARNGGEQ